MTKRLKEMESEAAALREMQAKVEKEMSSLQGWFLLFFAFVRFFLCFCEACPVCAYLRLSFFYPF